MSIKKGNFIEWKECLEDYLVKNVRITIGLLNNMLIFALHSLAIVFNDPYQRPYTFYLPDLPTKMFYDANEFELAHVRK